MVHIKYVVIPGRIRSVHDNDIHYIDAPTLMRLYNVDRKECIIRYNDFRDFGKNFDNLIELRPRSNGKYEI